MKQNIFVGFFQLQYFYINYHTKHFEVLIEFIYIMACHLLLHGISIYRINMECEPKTDYEHWLNQQQITSEIDIK